ncbi:MAG: chemotaxis protein CheB [Burkholderiaceae bacterium]
MRGDMSSNDASKDPTVTPYPIVGIGASAGGLDAFKQFFAAAPVDSGMAFVLVQHLDPTHDSLMADLLAKCTSMPVRQAEEGARVEPDHVYMIPPNRSMTIKSGVLHLSEPAERRGMRMAIDTFLRSLADDQGEWAVGIVLSGTGSDGTAGLRSIKANGGLTLAQDPASAAYDGMPSSAISAGVVDVVRGVELLPSALARYAGRPGRSRLRTERRQESDGRADQADAQLMSLLALLRTRQGLDFRQYKEATLLRRIERRMRLNHLDTLAAYIELLRDQPDELRRLSGDLLIGVTAFFRDAGAFEALEQEVIAPLVSRAWGPDPIRVWVAGCATGEEAYSIAMLFSEQMARQEKNVPVQIFASDIDTDALEVARIGIYPAGSAADLSPLRLEQHFDPYGPEGDRIRVKQGLREMIVFARQNLAADPPYSKVDLISCRNLLIYLQQALQERLIALFHFALRKNGRLLLGGSEGIGRHGMLFDSVGDKALRLFRRLDGPSAARADLMFPTAYSVNARAGSGGEPAGAGRRHRPAETAMRWVLEVFAPAVVVVDRKAQIQFQCGPVGRFLDHPFGEPTANLIEMAHEGLKTRLRSAIQRSAERNEIVEVPRVRMRNEGRYESVRICVRPLGGAQDAGDAWFMVSFEEPQALAASDEPGDPARAVLDESSLVRQLEEELKSTKEDLQSTIEEMETSNEELKASNEEVMSINEELQSTNEELETSKEELQSLNEELSTVNSQLQAKVQELEAAGNDISNLLVSADVATLFLDLDLQIKRYTPAVARLFHLRSGDVGRPLEELSATPMDPHLLEDARKVLATLVPIEAEVGADDDHWYIRRVLPYRTNDDRINGVVITYSDVTLVRRNEQLAGERLAKLEAVYQHAPIGLAFIDDDMRYQHVNEALARFNGVSVADHIGRTPWELLPAELAEQAKALKQEVLLSRKPRVNVRLRSRTAASGEYIRDWLASYFPVFARDGATLGVTIMVRDVTAERQEESCMLVERQVVSTLAPHHSLEHMATCVLEAFEDGFDLAASAFWMQVDGATSRQHRVRRPEVVHFDEALSTESAHLAGRVARSGAPVCTDELADAGLAPGTAAFLPVTDGDQHLGVVGLFFGERILISGPITACIARVGQRLGDHIGYARVHAQLEASESEFRALAENMPSIVTRFDRAGRHHYVNPAVRRATGLEPDHFIGKTNRELGLPEGLVAQWERAIESVFAEGHEVNDAFSFETPQGVRHYQARLVPEFDADGNVRHALGVTNDITDLKAAQEAIGEREQRIRRAMDELDALYQNAPVAFCVIDRELRFVRINDRLARSIGQPTRSLAGARIERFRADLPRGLEALLETVFANGQAVSEHTIAGAATSSATWSCWSVSLQPLRGGDANEDDGDVRAVSCMLRDITERVLTEVRLAARATAAEVTAVAGDHDQLLTGLSERFANVFDCQSITFWSAADGDSRWQHRVLRAQADASEPGPIEDAVARAADAREAQWLPVDDRDEVAYGFALPITTPTGTPGALRVRLRDAIPRNDDFLQSMNDIAHDVGEWWRRIEAEAALDGARLAAEAANASKSEFLANISHELRSPLTAILGYTELLAQQLEDDEQRGQVMTVRRNGQHLLRLLNDILDLAKMEAGKVAIEPVAVEPDRLIDEVASLMRVRAHEKGLSLEVVFDGPIPRTISTDPGRLRQILINLVGNGIKFTESGGVTIRTSLEDSSTPRLRVDVIDTGVGLTAEQRDSLFESFTQAETGPMRRFGGTGLGLTISRHLARLLGGDIVIESRKGLGSTFSLFVSPGDLTGVARVVGRTEFDGEAPSPQRPVAAIDCHVLVVDDHDDLRALVRYFLEAAGATVTTAAGGAEAVRVIESSLAEGGTRIDAVVIDMQMPEVDGFEATRRMRQLGYRRPIVALTAGAMVGERARCLAAGCTDYVSKPVDGAALVMVVSKYLPGRQAKRIGCQAGVDLAGRGRRQRARGGVLVPRDGRAERARLRPRVRRDGGTARCGSRSGTARHRAARSRRPRGGRAHPRRPTMRGDAHRGHEWLRARRCERGGVRSARTQAGRTRPVAWADLRSTRRTGRGCGQRTRVRESATRSGARRRTWPDWQAWPLRTIGRNDRQS